MLNSKYGNFAYRSNWIEKYISKDKVIEYDVPSTCAAHDDSVDAFLYSITKRLHHITCTWQIFKV